MFHFRIDERRYRILSAELTQAVTALLNLYVLGNCFPKFPHSHAPFVAQRFTFCLEQEPDLENVVSSTPVQLPGTLFILIFTTLLIPIHSESDSRVYFDCAYYWLLLVLLGMSYSGALQMPCWLMDWLINWLMTRVLLVVPVLRVFCMEIVDNIMHYFLQKLNFTQNCWITNSFYSDVSTEMSLSALHGILLLISVSQFGKR